jgi:two-component system, NarL family, response regulator NreC
MGDDVRIVVADDHRIVRAAVKLLLDIEDGLTVIGETGDVPSTERRVLAVRPDVLVLDLNMPGGSGLQAIPGLRDRVPETRIVVLTMQDEPAFAREALRHGASGYVLKEAAEYELVHAVRTAASGGTYLNPELSERIATRVT